MPDPLNDLYGAPLADFTELRNQLVKSLKKDGKKAEAAEVVKLKRPTLPAWAINQLARRDAETVQKLIDIQSSLGQATDAKSLQRLGGERRRAVTALTEAARKILQEGGQSASASTLEKISSTLLAVTTEEEQDLLRQGRLERELSSSGFDEAFGGPTEFEVDDEPTDPAAERRARERAQKLSKEADRAETKARSLLEKADALETELTDARQAAEEQGATAVALREQAEEALAQAES